MPFLTCWQIPQGDCAATEELAICFDRSGSRRLLIIPALFDEANKLRHLTVEVMRRLAEAGIDSFLPDLPGMNESLCPLDQQTLFDWRSAILSAAEQFRASHFLAIRGGALLAPQDLEGWYYAPASGPKLLRSLMRARTIAAREAGYSETIADIESKARAQGIELAGWRIGAAMFGELEHGELQAGVRHQTIAQSEIGGAAPWLRAEPGFDPAQADALASLIIAGLGEK